MRDFVTNKERLRFPFNKSADEMALLVISGVALFLGFLLIITN